MQILAAFINMTPASPVTAPTAHMPSPTIISSTGMRHVISFFICSKGEPLVILRHYAKI